MEYEEIIKQLLSSKSREEELIYAIELFKLDNNFKMILFEVSDGDINRIGIENFGLFKINGLNDYGKVYLFDKRTLKKMITEDDSGYQVILGNEFNIDLNIAQVITKFINERALDDDEENLIKYLRYKYPKVPINIMSFLQEQRFHFENGSNKKIFEILASISVFETVRHENLEAIPNVETGFSHADTWWRILMEKNSYSQEILDIKYYTIYSLLLKIIFLQMKFPSFSDHYVKRGELLDFVNNQLFVYLENELWFADQLFQNKKIATKIFNKANIHMNYAKIIKGIKNMTWDIFHVRLTEDLLEAETVNLNQDIVLPFFISQDRQLNNYINLNPIKKIVFSRNKMHLAREHNILSELSEKELNLFFSNSEKRLRKQKKLDLDYLINLSQKLENEILNLKELNK
jgi:hypothetical protein